MDGGFKDVRLDAKNWLIVAKVVEGSLLKFFFYKIVKACKDKGLSQWYF